MAGLKIQNLYKRYDNDGKKKKGAKVNPYAVNDLCLEAKEGEFVAFLGPSGCGKTTTLRMIAGLEDITAGEIYIGDTLVNNLHPKDRHIGLAFEDYAMYPPLTVYDNIGFNLKAKGVDKAEIDKRVREIAPLMQCDDLLDKMPVKLSGGQKQRVGIARALANDPKILLCDEATSALDPETTDSILELLNRINREMGITIVMITHQMEVVQKN